MKQRQPEPIVLTLCGSNNNPNCPTVEITTSEVYIKDDFGGTARMTLEQFEILLKKAKDIRSE